MTKQLLERWSENSDRLHWIQTHRSELEEATGLDIPVRLHEIDDWSDGHKAVVTRRLREQAGYYDETEDEDTTDTEVNDE